MAISKDLEYEISQYKEMANSNNAFNAKEAATNRAFQERMSSTSHQREVQDLIKAGLNPVLSANAGASTPAGSMATADTSANSAMATSFSSARQAETALKTAQIQANATMAAAAAAAGAQMYSANKALDAAKYQSDNSFRSSLFGNVMNAFASMTNAQTSRGSTLWGMLSNALAYGDAMTGIPGMDYQQAYSANAINGIMSAMNQNFGANPFLLTDSSRKSKNSDWSGVGDTYVDWKSYYNILSHLY